MVDPIDTPDAEISYHLFSICWYFLSMSLPIFPTLQQKKAEVIVIAINQPRKIHTSGWMLISIGIAYSQSIEREVLVGSTKRRL